jgi:hypothetical protein
MTTLLYKEFKLAKHPTMFMFLFLGAILLAPSYPYFVAFIYTCLSIFLIFLTGRENHDVLYTALLPVKKRDAVKARLGMVVLFELAQTIISVPFAVLSVAINPAGNAAGIEINPAFYGLVLVMFALFHLVFFTLFYKTADKVGIAFFWGATAITVYIGLVETLVAIVPALNTYLDTNDPAMITAQLPVLFAGIILYALLTLLTYKIAARRFERVDL